MRKLTLSTMGVFALATLLFSASAQPQTFREGFRDVVVYGGLTEPVAVRFAPDGRVVVAERSGIVKLFDGLDDPTADALEDVLTENVHDTGDRGLLGLAIDPEFPLRPYLYVLYAHDTGPGNGEPWGDTCPNPPGALDDGCVINGRISRLEISLDNQLIGDELVLLEGAWCQQYSSHSIGDLIFDADGYLLASAGDGASFIFADWGQGGGDPGSPTRRNPCDDPPGGPDIGLPSAQGGALRSQDLLTPGDPTTYDGSVLRIDVSELPVKAPADNPLVDNDVPDDDLVIAHGLRNPFRLALRPGTREIWSGDVGWNVWEELNVIADPADDRVENFGWPCYEGSYSDAGGPMLDVQSNYADLGTSLCNLVYNQGTIDLGGGAESVVTPPHYAYSHAERVVDGEECGLFSSSVAGLAFFEGTNYPNRYDGALFFQDSSRGCLWSILPGADGMPDSRLRESFAWETPSPVDLQLGPDGNLYYVTLLDGRVRRIEFVEQTELEASGSCPGQVTIQVTTNAAERRFALVSSASGGAFVLPTGACQGTRLGLDAPTLGGLFETDATGRLTISGPAAGAACGKLLQAVDLETCSISEVVAVP